jgi:hypothetical protein
MVGVHSYKRSGLIQIALLTVMLLALSGCNQNKDSSSAAAPAASTKSSASASKELDACTLVTKAEAEAVLGEHVKEGTSGPASMRGGSICMYESPDSLSARHITIRVESPNFDWNKYKEQMRVEGENMRPKPGRIREVSGLGKDAYFARHVLHVLTDKGTLTVIVFKDPGEAVAGEETETKAESAEKTLADKAVTRM